MLRTFMWTIPKLLQCKLLHVKTNILSRAMLIRLVRAKLHKYSGLGLGLGLGKYLRSKSTRVCKTDEQVSTHSINANQLRQWGEPVCQHTKKCTELRH